MSQLGHRLLSAPCSRRPSPTPPEKRAATATHPEPRARDPRDRGGGGDQRGKVTPRISCPPPPRRRCSEARPTTPAEALHQCLHLLPKQGVFNQYFLLSSAQVSNMARSSTELQKTKQKAKKKNPSAEGRAWLAAQRTFSRTTLSLVLQNTARSIGEPAVQTHGNSRTQRGRGPLTLH